MFPGPITVPEDGALRFSLAASVTNTVRARVHIQIGKKIQRPLEFVFAHSAGDRTVEFFTMDVPENSQIVGLNVFITDSIKRGQAFLRVHLMNRGFTMLLLARGYLQSAVDVVLGQNDEPGPGGGEGFIRSITGTNRAAGIEMSEVVPADAMWRLLVLRVQVVGGAAAFGPRFEITDGTTQKWRSQFTTVAIAATEVLVLAAGQNHFEGGTTHFELPENLLLPEGYVISTTDITADDDYAAPELWVEEWLIS